MLGLVLPALWLSLWGHTIKTIKNLSARAIRGLTGHLRSRPDPWLEAALRAAFAEFDRELELLLHDRPFPVPARAEGARHPNFPCG